MVRMELTPPKWDLPKLGRKGSLGPMVVVGPSGGAILQ